VVDLSLIYVVNQDPQKTQYDITFVGRTADLAALAQALEPAAGAARRLLTLTGVAGSGKTRLALQVAEALVADDDAAGIAVRAAALESAAWLADDRHDFRQAAALFAQSGALRRALGQEEQPAGPLINAAMEARSAGDYAHAAALLEQSLAQYRRLRRTGDGDLGLALSWGYRYTLLALVLRERGEYERPGALCEECLALARERGTRRASGSRC
jgi:hypothetical protein